VRQDGPHQMLQERAVHRLWENGGLRLKGGPAAAVPACLDAVVSFAQVPRTAATALVVAWSEHLRDCPLTRWLDASHQPGGRLHRAHA
jgi:hypothetical protein